MEKFFSKAIFYTCLCFFCPKAKSMADEAWALPVVAPRGGMGGTSPLTSAQAHFC